MSKGNNLQSLFCGILFCISVAALIIACLAFTRKGGGEYYEGIAAAEGSCCALDQANPAAVANCPTYPKGDCASGPCKWDPTAVGGCPAPCAATTSKEGCCCALDQNNPHEVALCPKYPKGDCAGGPCQWKPAAVGGCKYS
jgi:hypothetical protein